MNNRMSARDRIVNALLGDYSENKLLKLSPERSSQNPINNYDKIITKVDRIDRLSTDYNFERKQLKLGSIDNDNNLGIIIPDFDLMLPLSNWSLGQICDTAEVPTKYIKKCMASDEFDFAAENLNKWFNGIPEDKEFLLRTTAGRLHGFLTDRYAIFDDKDVLDVTSSALSENRNNRFNVADYLITPENLNLRIVSNEFINIDGEDLSVAYKIRNSRVGASSLEVEFFIYKWMCSNGMIVGGGKATVVTQRHVRVNKDMWYNKLNEIIEQTPVLTQYVKEAVESARVHSLNSENLEMLVREFQDSCNASNIAVNSIRDKMETYGGNTRWSFINALTEVAQDYSIDTRESFERYAGVILSKAA